MDEYKLVLNFGYIEDYACLLKRHQTNYSMDGIKQQLENVAFDNVRPIHHCKNGAYLVGLRVGNDKTVAIFSATMYCAQIVFDYCKKVASEREFQSYTVPEVHEVEEKVYHMYEIDCDGYDMREELPYYLIKNPIWALVKYIYRTKSYHAENKYVIVFNKLLNEQEAQHFHRVFDSTNLSYTYAQPVEFQE